MADSAAHLVDRVLPWVPIRQWVLSLPFGLRYRLAHDRELTADVLRVFVRAVFASLRRRSGPPRPGSDQSHGGAVIFVQRFGGALNLNVHFHTLVLDGVYRQSEESRALRFTPAPPPEPAELERILQRVVRGIARIIERRGLAEEPDRLTEDDPLLAQLLAAAVQGRAATGQRAGQRVLRFGDQVEMQPELNVAPAETPGLARIDGFSLHAGVAVPANDRQRLERLCRYVGRPAVASERLSKLDDGRLLYELRHRWRDGTTHVAFEPLELIDRLAALVPPPRFHTVRYHGVLASRSKHRASVVPEVVEAVARSLCGVVSCTPEADASTQASSVSGEASRSSRPSRYYTWPELMRRVFEIDVLRCPRCRAGPMRILAAIHPPATTEAILRSLGLPTRAPPITPARPITEDWSLAELPAEHYRGTCTDLPAA